MVIVVIPIGLLIIAFIIIGIKIGVEKSISRTPIDLVVTLGDFSKTSLGETFESIDTEIVRRLAMVNSGCPSQLVFPETTCSISSVKDAIELLGDNGYDYSKDDAKLIETMVRNTADVFNDMMETDVSFITPSKYKDSPKAKKREGLKADFVSEDAIAAIYPYSISKLLTLWRMAMHSIKKYHNIRFLEMYDPVENVLYKYDTENLKEGSVRKLDKQLGFK